MALGDNIGIGGLLALYTCVSAVSLFGQTSTFEGPSFEARKIELRAPELPQDATLHDATLLAQRFVDERLAVWRQRLKLEDWRISAVMTRRIDLAPQTLGGIRWDKTKKSAVIWVLDPADYALPFHEMLDDMELTVVHELVHLELTSLPRSQAHRGTEERAVSGIADALLGLDRRKQ